MLEAVLCKLHEYASFIATRSSRQGGRSIEGEHTFEGGRSFARLWYYSTELLLTVGLTPRPFPKGTVPFGGSKVPLYP